MTEPTKLPGRDFFTLEETAERWGLDIEELEHWARADLLKIKVGTTGAGTSLKPLVTGISRAERDRFEREKELGPFAPKKPEGHIDPRERRAMLNIIGALLELVKNPRPNRNCNDDVINELVNNWPEKYGISPTNLKKKFAEAKKSLDEDS